MKRIAANPSRTPLGEAASVSKMLHRFYPESRFGGYTDVDGTIAFYLRVRSLIPANGVVVDFGCGRGKFLEDPVAVRRDVRDIRNTGARIIGMDVDPEAASNPAVHEFHLLKPGEPWPLADQSADVVVADFVVEHLPDPKAFFREARRVLRPNGSVCVRTSNLLHYVALISRLLPERTHGSVLKKAQPDRLAKDVFPACYRCNTAGKLKKYMTAEGFDAVAYGFDSEPNYLAFSSLVYAMGVLYGRHAPKAFRSSLFAFGKLR